jgi:hypothetical protein
MRDECFRIYPQSPRTVEPSAHRATRVTLTVCINVAEPEVNVPVNDTTWLPACVPLSPHYYFHRHKLTFDTDGKQAEQRQSVR